MTTRLAACMWAAALFQLAAANPQQASFVKVVRAVLASDGLVHITDSRREFVASAERLSRLPADEQFQKTVSSIQVSADRRTVGWTALFPNCCTSYPLPLLLILYRDGRIVRRILPVERPEIWSWSFIDGGRRLVLLSNFPHGDSQDVLELHDSASGRLLARYRDGDATKPEWVRSFQAMHR